VSTHAIEAIEVLGQEICRIGKSLYDRGYVHGSTGNISVRIPEDAGGGFLITPTDACLGFLVSSKLSLLDRNGVQISGDRASKTLALHRRIYSAAPQAMCVIHTHSSYLVDLTLRGVWSEQDIVPAITPYYVMKVGHVPLVPYFPPGDIRVADYVERLIMQGAERDLPLRAVMCDRLGPQVWNETPSSAMATLEELEETAKLWLRGNQSAVPLSEAQIEELRQQFKVKW
jgi:ribulose-5-phosphate 4-epimerase/fuculose-1-phosphate aldolase